MFSVGSFIGWCIEVIFRRFFSSKNPERKWINPGFCTGPYLPIYGLALCVLYGLAIWGEGAGSVDTLSEQIWLFVFMSFIICVMELVGGLFLLKVFNIRLWDYRKNWGNICGMVCPKFAFFWILLAAAYYWLIHPVCNEWLYWLADHLAFSFFIGLFMGIFIIDLIYSGSMMLTMRKYGKENNLILQQDQIKTDMVLQGIQEDGHNHFMLPYGSKEKLQEHLEATKAQQSDSVYAVEKRTKK